MINGASPKRLTTPQSLGNNSLHLLLMPATQLELRPMFIPLKTAYYEAFANGTKTEELRAYGRAWNERTCVIGREVILSKGYGKQSRLRGHIWRFKKQHGTTFGSTYKAQILAVYNTLNIDIACISIELIHAS